MPTMIPSLWPQDIKLEVLSPLFILKSQVRGISDATKGVLDAEVTTVSGEGDFVTHRLDLIPTQLDGSRHRILSATHRESLYPVVVEADVYRPKPRKVPLSDVINTNFSSVMTGGLAAIDKMLVSTEPDRWPHPDDWRPIAASQDEFVSRVKEVLRSPQTRAMIESLLARSYEMTLATSQESSPTNAAKVP